MAMAAQRRRNRHGVYTIEAELALVKLDYCKFSFDLNANFKIKFVRSMVSWCKNYEIK